MSIAIPRFVYLSVSLLLLTSSAMAQHDPAGITGGGMIGGSTSRPTIKPATRPATKPRSTTPVVRRPTSTTNTADYYYQQGETLYNAQKYKEALDQYKGHGDQS